MTYEITISINEESAAGRNIESIATTEHLSREAAALKLLENLPVTRRSKATPEAMQIFGAFSAPEDAALMDEVMELVMEQRQRRNAEPPREF